MPGIVLAGESHPREEKCRRANDSATRRSGRRALNGCRQASDTCTRCPPVSFPSHDLSKVPSRTTRSRGFLCLCAYARPRCRSRLSGGEAASGGGVSGGAGGKGATASYGSASSGEGGTSNGGSGETPSASGQSNASAGAPSSGGSGSAGQSGSFEQSCVASATDACNRCLCSGCTQPLEQCANTQGCPEILACTRQSGCTGAACYCGDFDAVTCLGGQSNGPCKAVILEAPDSRVPSLVNRSAGPASDAALAIATCAEEGQPCAEACASR